jgi:hypothetical protein
LVGGQLVGGVPIFNIEPVWREVAVLLVVAAGIDTVAAISRFAYCAIA